MSQVVTFSISAILLSLPSLSLSLSLSPIPPSSLYPISPSSLSPISPSSLSPHSLTLTLSPCPFFLLFLQFYALLGSTPVRGEKEEVQFYHGLPNAILKSRPAR